MKEAWTEKEVKVLKKYYPIVGGQTNRSGGTKMKSRKAKLKGKLEKE